MDFDFNLILVPITLLLGLVWLVDKLWLKKHKVFKAQLAELKTANKAYETSQQQLTEVLKKHEFSDLLTVDLTNVESLTDEEQQRVQEFPEEVQQAQQALLKSKVQVVIVQENLQANKEPAPINWAYEFFPILAVVLIVRSFLFEPFNIPSSSMVPTLYTGDFILVNKYDYGIRLPLLNTKVIDVDKPKHGDVVVFRYPENPKMYYIKRVIGLPGDKVSYNQGVLSVNDKPLAIQPVDFVADKELTKQLYTAGQKSELGEKLTTETALTKGVEEEKQARYYQQTQGNHQHLVRYLHDVESDKNLDVSWQIPAGQYFFMGDNRDRSYDSRFWGFVPEENIAGKAVYVWMHKKPGLHLPSFADNGTIE